MVKLFYQAILNRNLFAEFFVHPRSICSIKKINFFFESKCLHQNTNSELKIRSNPIIMKLDTPEFHAIFTPKLRKLTEIFKKYNHEIRVAGGAVRDMLMGQTPADLDFATTATPEEMKAMFNAENIRMINNKGEKHGTITARIDDAVNFEVTTLRIDVVTDGRHAEVEFTTDWKLDANRRDLTINAMFLGLDGTIYDYFYGYEDLKAHRVRFVGKAENRIQEDYLRILRYFRFYGRIALKPDDHDSQTLDAIRANMSGLSRISGERIWSELSKILTGNFGGDLMLTMLSLGIAPHIGLPEHCNVAEFEKIWERSKTTKLKPPSLLAALLSSKEEVLHMYSRLKFSAYERDLCFFIVENREDKISVHPLRPYQLLVLHSKLKLDFVHEYVVELLKYRNDLELAKEFEKWRCPKFPISGYQLRDIGVPGGKQMGMVIKLLKDYWAEHDFKLSPEELLKHVPVILDELGLEPVTSPGKPSPKKSSN